MISPPETLWPANTFTPSIFGFESRPFRLDPSPFLCAIAGPLPRGLRTALCGLRISRLLRRWLPAQQLHFLDLESRQLRAVSGPAPVPLLRSVLEHAHLRPAQMLGH